MDVVKSWSQLMKLDLSFNQIEDLQGRNCVILKYHVFQPPLSLRYLNLSPNNISFLDQCSVSLKKWKIDTWYNLKKNLR